MFKNRKIGSSLGVGESQKHTLKVSRSYQTPLASLFGVEGTEQEGPYQGSQEDLRIAMLEAEHKKAKAIASFQSNRRFY